MTNGQAPAGWYPDGNDESIVRYWDGAAWTQHTSPAVASNAESTVTQPVVETPSVAAPSHLVADTSGSPSSTSTQSGNFWQRLSTGWKVGIGIAAALLVITAVSSSGEEEGTKASFVKSEPSATESSTPEVTETTEAPTPTPTPKPKPKPAGYGDQPADQRAVIKLIQSARTEYENADNSLQQGVALSNRDKKICAILGDGRVTNWTGQVYNLDSNGDGKGILGINIEPNTQLQTWNNAFSDAGDNTLIEPGPLLDRIANLKKGQVVRFSGKVLPELGEDSCFNNPRFTKDGKISKPLMIFRFSDVQG